MFWVVTEAKRAILEIEHYEKTVSWAAQTTLRDVIGKSELVRMISDRQALDEELQAIIDAKTSESIKERGALMVVPSGMAESLNTGVIGMAAAGFKQHEGDA